VGEIRTPNARIFCLPLYLQIITPLCVRDFMAQKFIFKNQTKCANDISLQLKLTNNEKYESLDN
jgi:hypothetical protein